MKKELSINIEKVEKNKNELSENLEEELTEALRDTLTRLIKMYMAYDFYSESNKDFINKMKKIIQKKERKK